MVTKRKSYAHLPDHDVDLLCRLCEQGYSAKAVQRVMRLCRVPAEKIPTPSQIYYVAKRNDAQCTGWRNGTSSKAQHELARLIKTARRPVRRK